MRKIVPLLLLFGLPRLLPAQILEPADTIGAPRLTISGSTVFDAGTIIQGTVIRDVFHFKNTGKRPLLIVDVRSSDGGFYINTWPREPIAPGGSGTFGFIYSSEGKMGLQHKVGMLMTNGYPAEVRIEFKCKVEAAPAPASARNECPFTVLDSSVCHFGTIQQGSSITHDFRIRNTSSVPLIIKSVDNGCGCAVAQWPKAPIAPGKIVVIKTLFNSTGKMGPTTQVFSIQVEGYKERVEVSLMGSVAILPKVFPYEDAPKRDGPH